MAFDLLERLGRMFGKRDAEQVLPGPEQATPAETTPMPESPTGRGRLPGSGHGCRRDDVRIRPRRHD